MKNKQECRVIEVRKDSIVVSLLDGHQEVVPKVFIQFEALLDDELQLIFDHEGNITKVEQKISSKGYEHLSNEKGESIEVLVSPAREIN